MTRTSDKHDRYGTGVVTLLGWTEKAVRLSRDGDEQFIPRSLLSHISENDLRHTSIGDEVEVEIREWKLRELGWI